MPDAETDDPLMLLLTYFDCGTLDVGHHHHHYYHHRGIQRYVYHHHHHHQTQTQMHHHHECRTMPFLFLRMRGGPGSGMKKKHKMGRSWGSAAFPSHFYHWQVGIRSWSSLGKP